ncbi:MAG: Gfo/Idh/MocA family oxidoreductase [Geminicoccaceae bacterium]
MKKIRYAVVGAGWISQEAFMPSVAATGNSVMTAIVSGSPEKARKLASFHGIEHVVDYAGYDDLLAGDIVDAVYVALPNSMHADYTIRAARAGKHVIVEKPLAPSIAECEAMIEAANTAGVKLMTAYRLHNEPGTVDAIERVRAGEIGDPRLFSSILSFTANEGNHRLEAAHWGGPLQDVGVYCLNAARHLFGCEPIEAHAVRSHGVEGDPRFAEVEESIAVILRFPQGRLAQFLASFGGDSRDSCTVVGTKGSLSLHPAFKFETATTMTRRKGDDIAWYPYPRTDHFAGQTAWFSDCILKDLPVESDGHEGLADVRALLAIEKAAATGMPQPIETPPRPSHPSAEMVRILPTTDRRLLL